MGPTIEGPDRQNRPTSRSARPSWIVLVRRWSSLPAAQRYAQLESWVAAPAIGAAVRSLAAILPLEEAAAGVLVPGSPLVTDPRPGARPGCWWLPRRKTGEARRPGPHGCGPLAEKKGHPTPRILLALGPRRLGGPMAGGPAVEAVLEARGTGPAAYPFWPAVRQPPSWLTPGGSPRLPGPNRGLRDTGGAPGPAKCSNRPDATDHRHRSSFAARDRRPGKRGLPAGPLLAARTPAAESSDPGASRHRPEGASSASMPTASRKGFPVRLPPDRPNFEVPPSKPLAGRKEKK